MKRLIIFILVLLLIPISIATYSITRTEPGEYAIINWTDVEFGINTTGDNVSFNCSLYLKTSRTDNFTENMTFAATNNTDSTGNFTFVDGDRVWWKIGCYDRVGGTSITNEDINTPTTLGRVDLDYDDDGVVDVVSWVNYTQPSDVNESATVASNNSVMQLNNNETVASVSLALAQLNDTDNVTMVSGTDYSIVANQVFVNSSTYEGNTSYWTYEYYNSTGLTEDTDFNLTATTKMINMMVSTYEGDTSYWNYSYPGQNKINEVNTTVRIFDVDEYYDEFIAIYLPLRFIGSVASPTCDTSSAGSIYYDTDGFTHFGCNSTDWNALY